MGRASTLAMALGAALALGACADGAGDLTTAPNSPAFQRAGGLVTACSPSDLQKYARNLFPSNSFALTQAKLITTKNANTEPALAAGYNVMAAVATLRAGTLAWTTAQQTNAVELTIQLIGCMDVALSDLTLTTVPLLRQALMDALDPDDSGAYAVPGALALVMSQDKLAGLQTAGTGSSFNAWLPGGAPGRALVLGREIESFATELGGGIAYDWSTVRPYGFTTYDGSAIVGLCASSLAQAGAMRIEHAHGSNTIRPYAFAAFLDCPETLGLGFPAARTFAGRLAQQLFALVQPQPAFASAALATGGPGGLIKSLSPFEVVDPDTVKVTFANHSPVDLAVNEIVKDSLGQVMQVTVTGANGVPWEAVDVTIVGVANNGATLAPSCNKQATDQNGVATFPGLSINKPGGVKLLASVTPSGDDDGTVYVGSDETLRFSVAPGTAPVPCP